MLIYKNDEIFVAIIIWKYAVNWFHKYLLHPGTEHTQATISKHYYRPNLRDYIRTHIKVCKNFQRNRNKTPSMPNYLLIKKKTFYDT